MEVQARASRSVFVRNLAIATTILGVIILAYALYLIIATPVPNPTLQPPLAQQQEQVRQRGFTYMFVALGIIVLPWLVYWIFFRL